MVLSTELRPGDQLYRPHLEDVQVGVIPPDLSKMSQGPCGHAYPQILGAPYVLQHYLRRINPPKGHLGIRAPVEEVSTIFQEMVHIPPFPVMLTSRMAA